MEKTKAWQGNRTCQFLKEWLWKVKVTFEQELKLTLNYETYMRDVKQALDNESGVQSPGKQSINGGANKKPETQTEVWLLNQAKSRVCVLKGKNLYVFHCCCNKLTQTQK